MEVYNVLGMSHAEVIDAIANNLGTMLTMLQFWVTATFALIVAFHFAGEGLTRNMMGLATALYIGAAIVALSAFLQASGWMMYWSDAGEAYTASRGLLTQGELATSAFFRISAVAGGAVLVVVGTIATVLYGLHVRKSASNAEAT